MVKLATERMHLTDIIKMLAYQDECDLLAFLQPHYARADQERRTLLQELFIGSGEIRACDHDLHIALDSLQSLASHSRRAGSLPYARSNIHRLPKLSRVHAVRCGPPPEPPSRSQSHQGRAKPPSRPPSPE